MANPEDQQARRSSASPCPTHGRPPSASAAAAARTGGGSAAAARPRADGEDAGAVVVRAPLAAVDGAKDAAAANAKYRTRVSVFKPFCLECLSINSPFFVLRPEKEKPAKAEDEPKTTAQSSGSIWNQELGLPGLSEAEEGDKKKKKEKGS